MLYWKQLATAMAAKDFGMEQGRALLHVYYKLTFALMQVAGRILAEPTKTVARPVDDDEINLEGKEIENRGKAGAAMLGMLHEHPNARKVNALFYPEAETKDFRQNGERQGGDDWSEGIALDLFLWHDAEAGEWVLEDFSTVDEHKENRAKGAKDAPVPAALFEELNSKLRFPKGALYYRCPDEASYRILRTTEPTTMGDWLRTVAIAGLMVGLAVASGGTSIPAQVIMIGSAVAMAGAEIADMAAESQQGMLTTERVVVHSALIASCILGGTSGALGIVEKLGKLGVMGGRVARVVAGMQVGADGVCVAVFTDEAFKGLKAAADDPEGVTFTRLLAFFLQMGMNGLMLYGMKGSMLEAAASNGIVKQPPKLYPNFSETESQIISEVIEFKNSKAFLEIQKAHEEQRTVEVEFNGMKVLYQHDYTHSEGFGLGPNEFMIGPRAFVSNEELAKTLLHERFRNHQDPHTTLRVGESTIFTKNAFNFAEEAYNHVVK